MSPTTTPINIRIASNPNPTFIRKIPKITAGSTKKKHEKGAIKTSIKTTNK
jgi:hypothetical protein